MIQPESRWITAASFTSSFQIGADCLAVAVLLLRSVASRSSQPRMVAGGLKVLLDPLAFLALPFLPALGYNQRHAPEVGQSEECNRAYTRHSWRVSRRHKPRCLPDHVVSDHGGVHRRYCTHWRGYSGPGVDLLALLAME